MIECSPNIPEFRSSFRSFDGLHSFDLVFRFVYNAANFPIQPHPMALTAGTRIGPYTVTAPLGEGGMGIVFRAHDTKLQRDRRRPERTAC